MSDPDAVHADDFMESFRLAQKVKTALKAKGKLRGWTRCPRCGGRIVAALLGPKHHLHMACATLNCIRVME